MKLSKNGIKVLTAQYRAVLRKCLLINMGLFILPTTVFANTLTDSISDSQEMYSAINIKNKTASITESEIIGKENDDFIFDKAVVNITNSDIETEGNLSIINESNLTFSYKAENWWEEEDGKLAPGSGFLGTIVKISDSTLTLGEQNAQNEHAYIGADKDFIISNSKIDLYGEAILAFEGDMERGAGKFEISNGSELTLNENSSLRIGEEGRTSKAPLIISGSKITMKDSSNISFEGNNKEATKITNSNIQMWNNSSMSLNDLSMEHSHILMKNSSELSLNNLTMEKSHIILNDASTLNVENVKFDKGSSINGQNGSNKKNKIKFSGDVDFSGFFDPAEADVEGNLTRGGYDDEIAYNLNSGSTLKYTNDSSLYEDGKHTHEVNEERTGSEKIETINGEDITRKTFTDGKYALNSITFNGGTLDIANGKATDIKLASLKLSKDSNIMLDVDLANEKMDRFVGTEVEGSANLNISKLNLISDAKSEETSIDFTKNPELLAATNYTGATSGLKALSPIYSYDVEYDKENGDFIFTRGGGSSVSDYNPAVYAGSVVGQTLATIQSTITQTAFSSLNNTLPQKDNAWVSVIGFDDTVDMKSFNNVDSEMYSLVGGVNSDAKHFDNFDATYGLYAGYINSEQKYDGNKIEQNGGYIGLDSVLSKGNAELLASVNTGYIRNEDKHSFGNDKFDTYFTGVAVKAGYNYDLSNGLSVVPNLYAGYTFVNNEDYTSKSGVKIKNDNLHLFEVAPGVKVNKDFNNGWTGYAQAKYAFIMDNGGDADVNNINLPNISAKDYVEYGLGANKALNDSWSLSAEINRRDGGREGWNGNLNIKYNF